MGHTLKKRETDACPINAFDKVHALGCQIRDLVLPFDLSLVPHVDFDEGTARIRKMVDARLDEGPGTVFIGVGGESGSGKTRFAKLLGYPCISMDDYFKVDYKLGDQEKRKGLEFGRLRSDLKHLARGETIQKPVVEWKSREEKRTEPFGPHRVVVVEGLLALDPKLSKFYSMRVYVESDRQVARERVLARGVSERNMTPAEVTHLIGNVVEPLGKIYTRNTKRNADLIVVNE